MANALVYQYTFTVLRKSEGVPLQNKVITELAFGLDGFFVPYSNRKELHSVMSLFDHGNEGFPVINITFGLTKASVENLEFLIEVLTVPAKLLPFHREQLEKVVAQMLEDENFKLWWSSDPRGPRKRPLVDKQKILQQLKEIPAYSGASDLQLEDIDISISDALEFFGFDKATKARDLKKTFKKKFREYQLKHHPDSASGDEKTFMHVQNCRDVLEKWMKRS